MPLIKTLAELRNLETVDFDQCRTGLETTKPARLLIKRIKLDHLKGLRCDHIKREFTRADGTKYTALHAA